MFKKIIWASIFAAGASFVALSNDPLNDIAGFLIAGNIPGTEVSVGFWSTIAIVCALSWAAWVGMRHASLQMLAHTAMQIKNERLRQESNEATEITFDHSQRSVIAAPSSEAA